VTPGEKNIQEILDERNKLFDDYRSVENIKAEIATLKKKYQPQNASPSKTLKADSDGDFKEQIAEKMEKVTIERGMITNNKDLINKKTEQIDAYHAQVHLAIAITAFLALILIIIISTFVFN
jgi:D-serine dehydratase